MRCPYCASEIHDEALVCAICRRDVQLVRQLGLRIQDLEKQLAVLSEQVAAPGVVVPPVEEAASTPDIATTPLRLGLTGWLLGGAAPLALLLGAHWLIVVAYDLNTLFLRIVSLLIPLPFGLLATFRETRYRSEFLVLAGALACLAVLGMSSLTAMVDHTPILPQGWREWREFAEYAASIGLSLIAGGLMGRIVRQRQHSAVRIEKARGLALKLAELVSSSHSGAEKFETTVKKIRELGASLSVAGATSASAYMGLKNFFGN